MAIVVNRREAVLIMPELVLLFAGENADVSKVDLVIVQGLISFR